MAHRLARFILAGALGAGVIAVGADVARADLPPAPVEPAPPSQDPSTQDPPMPPAPFPVTAWMWPSVFPKCWPAWVPPGEPAPPAGDVRMGMFQVPLSPCPAPPAPPPGQPYPPLPPPPPPYPGCRWGSTSLCVPGQELWGPLPPGYYGPQSWYSH